MKPRSLKHQIPAGVRRALEMVKAGHEFHPADGSLEPIAQWVNDNYPAAGPPDASSAAASRNLAAAAAALARRASSTYSEARAAAARENGKKGGRPRKAR